MLESLRRKEQFRQVWGVSPKSINQKRNLKTVIAAHKVSFADAEPEAEPEPTLNEVVGADEEVSEEGESEVVVETEAGVEEIVSTLDFSIPSDLFLQYIDANIPSSLTGDDFDFATALSCVDDVFTSHHPAKDDDDKLEEDDMEIDSDVAGADNLDLNGGKAETFHSAAGSPDSEDNSSADGKNQPVDIVVEPPAAARQAAAEPFDIRSLIAAAKTYKRENSRKAKSVRFLTPQKSDILMYNNDDNDDADSDVSDEDVDDAKENCAAACVSVNIPVNILNLLNLKNNLLTGERV